MISVARRPNPVRAIAAATALLAAPYAAPHDACVLLRLLAPSQDAFAPDPYSTEMPFLSDTWPNER